MQIYVMKDLSYFEYKSIGDIYCRIGQNRQFYIKMLQIGKESI